MKRFYLFVLSGLTLISCKEKQTELAVAQVETSANFNTEAVSKFWEVVDVLKNDNTLNDSLWDSYYELPGNKRYMEKNRGEAQVLQHRGFLELVFRPSMADSLSKTIEKGEVSNNDIFQNLIYIKDNEKAIREYMTSLVSPDYLPAAIKLTKKYLPQNSYEPISNNLTIYMQAITYDAAVQDSSMYFGLSIVHDFDKVQPGTVAAHELHHVLRKENEIYGSLSPKDSASLWVIRKINNEGSADLIDKKIAVEPKNNTLMGPLFKQVLLSDIGPVIQQLDMALVNNSKDEQEFVTTDEFNKILNYFSGHIPGYYMAEVIDRNGLKEELIDGCENPFNIFYLYDRAAEKDAAAPVRFSDETMEYLRMLEQKAFKEGASKA